MQTITIAIRNEDALQTIKELEEKHFIRIVEKDNMNTPAIPGDKLSIGKFKKWIDDAEQSPTVSLEEAKSIWSMKRSRLQKLTR